MDASHIFIGVAGFALTAETYLAQSIFPNVILCSLIGCSASAFYALHRLIQIRQYGSESSRRMRMLMSYRPLILFFFFFFAVSALFIIAIFYSAYYWFWLGLGLASLAYLFPWIKKQLRLRDIPFVKIWAIAVSWSCITVLLPCYLDVLGTSWNTEMLIERFLFFLLITIPFDIRDVKEDRQLGVKTFATTLPGAVLNYAGLLIVVFHGVVLWTGPFSTNYQWSLQIAAVLGLLLLYLTNDKRPLWYFSFGLDGLIVLRVLLLLCLSAL